jgi:hypothetical protein
MSREVSDDRLATAREVVAMLRMNPDFRSSVAINSSGECPIVVASVDDAVSEIVQRIEAIGTPVTLCVRAGSSSMTVATIKEASAGEPSRDLHHVAPSATIGMFIAYLWQTGTFTFNIAEPSETEATGKYELEFA